MSRYGVEVSSCVPTDPVRRDPLHDGPLSLLIVQGSRSRRVELPRGGRVRIGRDPSAEICLSDSSTSRLHAELQIDRRVFVRDLGSRNGTRLAGRPLSPHQPKEICCGEAIELGKTVVFVHRANDIPSLGMHQRAGGRRNSPMSQVQRLCRHAASVDANVVLVGETGSGKATLGRMIHRFSARGETPLHHLDGGALDEAMVAELFDDRWNRAGRGEPTLLLRQIGALPFDVQTRLVALSQSTNGRPATRIIATSIEHPAALASVGSLRRELRFRLEQLVIEVPPLRERVDELPRLAAKAIDDACETQSIRQAPELSDPLLAQMQDYAWPGNLRELENRVAAALLRWSGGPLTVDHMRLHDAAAITQLVGPTSPERDRIIEALSQCAGNQSQAAKLLGISRRTLTSRLDRYHIPRPRKRRASA